MKKKTEMMSDFILENSKAISMTALIALSITLIFGVLFI